MNLGRRRRQTAPVLELLASESLDTMSGDEGRCWETARSANDTEK